MNVVSRIEVLETLILCRTLFLKFFFNGFNGEELLAFLVKEGSIRILTGNKILGMTINLLQ